MNKYIGQPCTSCNTPIREDDDVVVCPDCGSPYHKACYTEEGRCINVSLHESGESWQPYHTEHAPDDSSRSEESSHSETVGVICPFCNTANAPGSSFCSNCGRPFNTNQQFNGNPYSTPFGVPFGGNTANAETDVDGNTIGEYSRYLGFKSYYFLPKFMRFAKNKSKFSFNFSAFLFPHFYFLYRKMNVLGYIILIISTLLSMPYVIYSLAQYGYVLCDWVMTDGFVALCNGANLISNIICIFCGLFANWLYYKKSKSDISKLKAEAATEHELNEKITAAGGTSTLNLVLAFLVQSASVVAVLAMLSYNFWGI